MAARIDKERRLVSFRLPADVIDLIDRAAEATYRDRTAFVVEAATRHAEEVLCDRTLLRLSDKDYDDFVAALENPPEPPQALIDFLRPAVNRPR
jgi:uncharacterized protein (DUF1778 family)